MVQSPRREDVKWENTGLRAGEAETDTPQRKSGRLNARKPMVSCALWSQVGLNGILRASRQAAWKRRDNTPLGEDPPCDLQTAENTKLHFNNLEIKDSLEPIFTKFKLQLDLDKEILY